MAPARSSATELPTPGAWFADASVRRAVVRIAAGGRWLVERFPVDEVTPPDPDGWSTVRLPVASEQWLVTTLLRLGPEAELMEPEEWRPAVAEAAAAVLARYRRS